MAIADFAKKAIEEKKKQPKARVADFAKKAVEDKGQTKSVPVSDNKKQNAVKQNTFQVPESRKSNDSPAAFVSGEIKPNTYTIPESRKESSTDEISAKYSKDNKDGAKTVLEKINPEIKADVFSVQSAKGTDSKKELENKIKQNEEKIINIASGMRGNDASKVNEINAIKAENEKLKDEYNRRYNSVEYYDNKAHQPGQNEARQADKAIAQYNAYKNDLENNIEYLKKNPNATFMLDGGKKVSAQTLFLDYTAKHAQVVSEIERLTKYRDYYKNLTPEQQKALIEEHNATAKSNKIKQRLKDEYGINPDTFSPDDFDKWATSHGFELRTVGEFNKSAKWMPKMSYKKGDYKPSKQEKKDLKVLEALSENNRNKQMQDVDRGVLISGLYGVTDNMMFGIPAAMDDYKSKRAYKKSGLDPKEYVSMAQAMEKTSDAHSVAYGVGAAIPSLVELMAGGEIVESATKGIKGFSSLPKWVQASINSGLNFATINGTRTGVKTGNAEQTIVSALLGLLGGAVGGTASAGTNIGLSKLLQNTNIKNLIAVNAIKNGISGVAFAGGDIGSTYFLYPKEYRPKPNEIIRDLFSALAFSAITSTIKNIETSKANKARLDDMCKQISEQYERLVKNSVSNATVDETGKVISATGNFKEMAENVIAYTENMEKFISSAEFVGQGQYVKNILTNLETIKNNAQSFLVNLPGETPSSGTAQNTGNATIPTYNMLPPVGNTVTPPGATSTTIQKTGTVPENGVSVNNTESQMPKDTVAPESPKATETEVPKATETPKAETPKTETVQPKATGPKVENTPDVVSDETAPVKTFAPENSSQSVKTIESKLIYQGANDDVREKIVNKAVDIEKKLEGTDHTVTDIFNGIAKEISQKGGAKNAGEYWYKFYDRLESLYPEKKIETFPKPQTEVAPTKPFTKAEIKALKQNNGQPPVVFDIGGKKYVSNGYFALISDNNGVESVRSAYFPNGGDLIRPNSSGVEKLLVGKDVGEVKELHIRETGSGKNKVQMAVCVIDDTAYAFNPQFTTLIRGRSTNTRVISSGSVGNTLFVGYDDSGNVTGFIMPITAQGEVEINGKNIPFATKESLAKYANIPDDIKPLFDKYNGKELSDGENTYRVRYDAGYNKFLFEKVLPDGKTQKFGAQIVKGEDMETYVSHLEKAAEIYKENAVKDAQRAEEQKAQEAAKAEKEKNVTAFVSDMSPMQQGKVRGALLKNGRYEFIERAIADGKQAVIRNHFVDKYKAMSLREAIKSTARRANEEMDIFKLVKKIEADGLQKDSADAIKLREQYPLVYAKLFNDNSYLSSPYIKPEYRMSNGDNTYTPITKTEYDYAKFLENANAVTGVDAENMHDTNSAPDDQYAVLDTLGLTNEEKGAIIEYKGSKSYKINEKLYDDIPLTEADKGFIEQVNKALDKFPDYEGKVYRYEGYYHEQDFIDLVNEHKKQSEITKPAFISTSKDINGYKVEADYVILYEIDGVSGKDVANIGVKSEQEVLFKTNTTFEVLDVSVNGKTAIIKLKERIENEISRTDSQEGNAGRDLESSEQTEPTRERQSEPVGISGVGRGSANDVELSESPTRRKSETTDIREEMGNHRGDGREVRGAGTVQGEEQKRTSDVIPHAQENTSLTEKCTLTPTKRTDNGKDIWVVSLKDKISKPDFDALRKEVKAVGGYYSHFAKTPDGKAIPGFIFNEEPTDNAIKVFNDFFGVEEQHKNPFANNTKQAEDIEKRIVDNSSKIEKTGGDKLFQAVNAVLNDENMSGNVITAFQESALKGWNKDDADSSTTVKRRKIKKAIFNVVQDKEKTEQCFKAIKESFNNAKNTAESKAESLNNQPKKDIIDGDKPVSNDAQGNAEKPDLHVGDIIEHDNKQWVVTSTDFFMEFENVDKNDSDPMFGYVGGMDSFKKTHDYKLVKSATEQVKTDNKVDKDGVKNDEPQSDILAGESTSNGGRLRAGASGADAENGIEEADRLNRDSSGQGLPKPVGADGNRPDVRNDSEGVHGTDDRTDVKDKADGVTTEVNAEEPQTVQTEVSKLEKKRPSNKGNFVITNDIAQEFDSTPPSAKDNIEAIELLLTLENEGRAATADEKKILAKYKGWGGIDTRYIPYELSSRFGRLFDWEQRKAMQSSQNNAFFTPTKVIDAMYEGLKRMGFKGGNVLETSMGVGNFFGRMPSAMVAKSALTGVELESYTARIAQYLYPGATVINKPFQDVAIKNGSFDLVIGNVPFGQNKISYNKKRYSLHNYFILSSLDKVRDGGIVAVITSAGTLDSHSIDARKAIMDKADVVACYKLPEKVFSRNASTDVQTDLLILRKRAQGAKPSGDSILDTKTAIGGLRVNEYFIKHPENVLGTLAKGTNAWGDITTVLDNGDFYEKLNAAMKKLPKDLISGKIDLKPVETIVSLSDKPRFFEKNGKLYADDGAGTAVAVSKNQASTVRDYIAVRDAYKEMLDAYDRDLPEEDIKPLRDSLSKKYDTFYKNHGAITGDGKKKIGAKKSANNTFLEADADYYLVSGLERYDAQNSKFTKSALFEKDTLRKKKITSVDASSDALAVSLNESGKIDFARMQELTGKTEEQLAEELKGEIVYTPDGDYVLTDIYLSGNIYEKLEAVKGKPEFREQQAMLEKVIPTPKSASDITVKLGANYIDAKYITDFAKEVLDSYLTIRKDISGRWLIEGVKQSRYGDVVNVKYGCKAFNAVQLLEKILNDSEITATKREGIGDKAVTVLDVEMTDVARQKADDIRAAFEKWVFADSDRRADIVNTYNRTYNNYRPLDYERIAEKLSFDSMDDTLKAKLYPHQKKGIARFLFGGNILFAHGVGTGKTFEMIASVMEAKRMGIINKAAMVVPNNKVVDFKNDIVQAYPNAKVLVIDTANKKRQTMLGLVNSNDWDIVLIARTTFTKIPVSAELQSHFMSEQLENLERQIAEATYDRGVSKRQLKGLITQRDNLEQKIKDLDAETKRDENSVDFEKLGIDCICVDEAHNYKSIMTPTKLDIKGLVNRNNAQMANDMLMKLDYLRSVDGKIIFGTGTPITNTVSEIYNMMRMVRPDVLEDAGIHSLDEWVNTFAKIDTTTEIGIDNQIKQKSTQIIRSFINVPEMIGMFRQFADIVFTEDVVKNLPKAKYIDVELDGAAEHKQIEEQISSVIAGAKKSDLLKIYGQLMSMADAASVDLRMLSGAESEYNIFKDYSPDELEYENSKINTMCDNVYKEYTASNGIKGTQIIFCDKGSGSGTVYSFNLHKDIMQKLIERGIPEEQIVIIKNQSDAQLEALYEKVNAGEVRVLIGTSQKMAEGLNVQKRVVAIHHPTVTYKPSDKEQGDARGVRAGNINDEVHIYRYLQKNTFDSHKWQAQDRKGEMISKALRGELVTEMEDIGADEESGAGVDAATAMAITSGNPLVKEKIDIDKEVVRLKTLQRNYMNEIYRYQDAISKNPAKISQLTRYGDNIEQDIATRDKFGEKASIVIKGKTFEKQTEANKALAEAVKTAPKNGQFTKLGTYNGFDIMFKGETGGMNYALALKGLNDYAVEYAGNGNNIARISGVLARLDAELTKVRERVENLKSNLEFAKQEVTRPFEKEKELASAIEKQKDITYRYEHYGEKTENEKNTEENKSEEKYSITESGDNNGRSNSLRKDEGRFTDARATVKGKPMFRIGPKALGKRGRQQYVEKLDRGYDTERAIKHNSVRAEFIKEHAYNDDMREMVQDLKDAGFNKVGFFIGDGRLAYSPLSSCSAIIFPGVKEVYLRYDDEDYSPRQLAVHEKGHDIYGSKIGKKIRRIIENSLSLAERTAIMQQKRYKLYSEILKNPDEVFEEFVCDILGGMNDYSYTRFEELMKAFWNQDYEFIDKYTPADYNEIIDAGGNNAALDNIGFGDEYSLNRNSAVDKQNNISQKDVKYSFTTAEEDTDSLTPERREEIHKQFEKDRAGIEKPTKKQVWGERAAWVAHNMTRVFPNIPERGERGTFFAEFRKDMIQWKNLPTTASFMVQDKLNKMTEGLSPDEFKTFSELVYFLDLQEEAQIQKERGYDEILLPNEITPDEVNAIVDELNAEASDEVKQALIKRQNIWDELKDRYVALNQYIGFDTEDKFKRKNYYHHQVIEYMNGKGSGTGGEIGIKAGRGWLKERHGSTKAINTDFLAVEYKAMLQMQYDVYIAETLGNIKKQYDIKPKLEKEALNSNKKAINAIIAKEATDETGNLMVDGNGKPDSKTYKEQQWYNSRIMFGFSGLFDLAERGELPTFGGEYQSVVNALKNRNLNTPALYKYVGLLANTELAENATDEQEQAVISARTVLKYTAQKKAWVKETLGSDYQTWETLAKGMSDKYSIHQPRRGNYFYTKTIIDEDAFNQAETEMILSLANSELNLGDVDIKKLFNQYADTIRLMGVAYEQWVLPKEIVDTMQEIANPKQASEGAKLARGIISAWKGWATSVNPLRTVKFGLRNFFGDLDAVIAGNPNITLYSKRAVQEIYQAMKHKNYSPEFMEWVERGGYTSMIFANEMDTEMQDKIFAHLKEKEGKSIFDIPAKLFEKYYNGVENAHNFREAILRYSAYLYFKDAIKHNEGQAKDFVASNRFIVRGLNSIEDKAYQLSKDLLGAYDEVGKMGQTLRRYWVPFYSFTETNLKRYYRMFENILASDKSIPKKAGKLLLKILMVNMLGLLMAAWNKLVKKDDDDKLPPSVREIPHLTLGKIGDNIYAFRQLGSFSELLEWFGLDDYKLTSDDWTAPIDKAYSMITPFVKLPVELASGLNFYPSLSQPRAIRDKWQHFFNSFGVDSIYNEATGKPTRGIGDTLKGAVTYSYDYKESAYYEILDLKRQFQGKTDNTIYGTTQKSNALYYMKTAIRYKDEKAALKYLDAYFENGGTVKGIKQSIATLNPMYGFTGKDTMEKGNAFVASLSDDEKEKLRIAQDFYDEDLALPENVLALLGKKDITDEEARNVLKNYIKTKCK